MISKQEINKINSEFVIISDLITIGNYFEALKLVDGIFNSYLSNKSVEINCCGFYIDIGSGLQDSDLIEKGINIGTKSFDPGLDNSNHATALYNVANGHYALYTLQIFQNKVTVYTRDHLLKSKCLYQDLLEIMGSKDKLFKKQVYVNYANTLDTLGRGIEALYMYNEALKIDKNFSMAIGNIAIQQCNFAEISGNYTSQIFIEAYQSIANILKKKDLVTIGGSSSVNSFKKYLKYIEEKINNPAILRRKIIHPTIDITKLDHFTGSAIKFFKDNNLFLNLHIHNKDCTRAIEDSIGLNLSTSKDAEKLNRYFDQVIQDYVVVRTSLFTAKHMISDYKGLDNLTKYSDGNNTETRHNLYGGMLQSIFKNSYDLLDKIGYFLNTYLSLGIKENRIYFHNVCAVLEKKGYVATYKPLSAIYDIYSDLTDGKYQYYKRIRDSATHRVVEIKIRDSNKYDVDYLEVVHLLVLVKSVIIYCLAFVNNKETIKQ